MTVFASAYRQLKPAEKLFVDGYVARIEAEAAQRHERVSNALYRPIPGDVYDASRGMLDKPMVVAAVTERVTQLAADQELSPARVIKEWMALAFSNVLNYQTIGEDGQPYIDFSRCTPEEMAAVAAVEVEEKPNRFGGVDRKVKYKLHDKPTALIQLGKYMGLADSDNPHWRAENARPANARTLPAGSSVDDAQNRYARLING